MGARNRVYASARKSQKAKSSIRFTPEVPAVQLKAEAPQQALPDLNPDTSVFQTDWDNPFANCFGSAAPPEAASSLPIQAKLTVGAVGNRYEQEADTVAAQVVKSINSSQPSDSVQREGEEEDELQMQPQEILQRVGHEGGAVSSGLESQIQSAKGGGQSLDSGLQRSMGQAMGTDFSNVKVHTDSQSDQLNKSIQSKAFTTGQDIFFRQGEYAPDSTGGQELIAHELTHVVQQSGTGLQRHSDDIQRFWGLGKALGLGKKKKRKKKKQKTSNTNYQSVPPKTTGVNSVEVIPNTVDEGDTNYQSVPQKTTGKNYVDATSTTVDEGDTNYQSVPQKTTGKNYVDVTSTTVDEGDTNYQSVPPQTTTVDEGDISYQSAPPNTAGGNYVEVTPNTVDEGDTNYQSVPTNTAGGRALPDQGIFSSGNREKNREAPLKYPALKKRRDTYAGEDKNSWKIAHVKEVFENLEKAVQEGTLLEKHGMPSIEQALQKWYGWSPEDVEKYYINRETPQVKYLDKASRTQYELKGGSPLTQQVDDPNTGDIYQQPFDTSKMYSKVAGNGYAIYVMSPDGSLYSHGHKVGLFHHSSFLAGLPTSGAGEIKVINGIVKAITNKSGHYHPTEEQLAQTLQELKSRGVDLSAVELTFYDKKGNPSHHYAEDWLKSYQVNSNGNSGGV